MRVKINSCLAPRVWHGFRSTQSVLIELLQPETASEWDAYVDGHPESTCYHLRAWQATAKDAYGIDAPYLLARDRAGSRIRGALPLFSVHGVVQRHVTNGLFGAYGTILGDDETTRQALLHAAFDHFESTRARHFMLKSSRPIAMAGTGLGLEQLDGWVTASLDLKPGCERLWKGFRDKIRNCVRKAQKNKLALRVGHSQLEAFYDVLAENMHSKGAPIYGLRFMRKLLTSLDRRAEVLTLWHEGRTVAGALVIKHRETICVPFASSRPGSLHLCPNNLLYWEIIRYGCFHGMKKLDFGRSMRDSGALAFKLGWGATIEEQPTYVRSSGSQNLRIDPHDRRVELFTRGWKRLPRGLVDAAGPLVCSQVAGLI